MKLSLHIASIAVLVLTLEMTNGLAIAKKAPIPVTACGQVLNVKGTEYVFTGNNSCGNTCPAAVITIAASNIHLDTAGFTWSAICAVVGINDGLSNIRIDGGGDLSGGDGLTIGKDSHVVVNGISASASSDLGGSGTGLRITGAKDVTVTGSNIGGGVAGIAGSVDHGTFSGNTVTTFGLSSVGGITLTGAKNLIKNNTITELSDGATSTNVGIGVPSGARVLSNTVKQFATGISIAGDSNMVLSNTVTGTSAGAQNPSTDGIDAAKGAIHNSIQMNTVSGNQFDLFENNGPPCVNKWSKNVFTTSGGAVACIH